MEISILGYQYSLYYFQSWVNAQQFIMGLSSKNLPFFQELDDSSKEQLQNLEKKVNQYNRMNFIKRWWLRLTTPFYKDIGNEKAILLLLRLRQCINSALLCSSQCVTNIGWKSNYWCLHQKSIEIISLFYEFFRLKKKRLYHFLGEKNREAMKLLSERCLATDILTRYPMEDLLPFNSSKPSPLKKLLTKIGGLFSHRKAKEAEYKLSVVKEKPRQKDSEAFLKLNEIKAAYINYYAYLKQGEYKIDLTEELKSTITKSLIHFFANTSSFPVEPDVRYYIKKLATLQLKWEKKIAYLEKITQQSNPKTDKKALETDENNPFINLSKFMDWISKEQLILLAHPLEEQERIKGNFIIPFVINQLKLWLKSWDVEINNQPELDRIFHSLDRNEELNLFFEKLSQLIYKNTPPILTPEDLFIINNDNKLFSSKNYFMNAYKKAFPKPDIEKTPGVYEQPRRKFLKQDSDERYPIAQSICNTQKRRVSWS